MIAKMKQEGLLSTSAHTQCTETLGTKFISTMPKGIGSTKLGFWVNDAILQYVFKDISTGMV